MKAGVEGKVGVRRGMHMLCIPGRRAWESGGMKGACTIPVSKFSLTQPGFYSRLYKYNFCPRFYLPGQGLKAGCTYHDSHDKQ